jgi:hypothetical protein
MASLIGASMGRIGCVGNSLAKKNAGNLESRVAFYQVPRRESRRRSRLRSISPNLPPFREIRLGNNCGSGSCEEIPYADAQGIFARPQGIVSGFSTAAGSVQPTPSYRRRRLDTDPGNSIRKRSACIWTSRERRSLSPAKGKFRSRSEKIRLRTEKFRLRNVFVSHPIRQTIEIVFGS